MAVDDHRRRNKISNGNGIDRVVGKLAAGDPVNRRIEMGASVLAA